MIENKKILITGGAGFIGSHLVDNLMDLNPKKLIVVDNLSSGNENNLQNHLNSENFELIETDIRDKSTLNKIEKVDFIFHLAALVSVPQSIEKPELNHEINETGFLNILEYARTNKISKIFYASSSAVYGDGHGKTSLSENVLPNPKSPYGLSKYINELYAKSYYQAYGIKSIGFRFFNVFGERQSFDSPYSGVISIFLNKTKQNQPLYIYGDGNQVRDYVYVKDLVNALILGVNSEFKCNVYNVGTAIPTSVNDLFLLISNLNNYQMKPNMLEERKGDINFSLADISNIENQLGYKNKFSVEEGLKDMLYES